MLKGVKIARLFGLVAQLVQSARLISVRSEVRIFPGPLGKPLEQDIFVVGSGDVAQLGERRLCKPEVAGSSPVVSNVFFEETNR